MIILLDIPEELQTINDRFRLIKTLFELETTKKQIEFLTLMTNEAGAKIIKLTQDVEDAKKEADKLMMNKIRFYEEELNKLRKSGL